MESRRFREITKTINDCRKEFTVNPVLQQEADQKTKQALRALQTFVRSQPIDELLLFLDYSKLPAYLTKLTNVAKQKCTNKSAQDCNRQEEEKFNIQDTIDIYAHLKSLKELA